MKRQRVTLKDVAAEAGVSRQTVSRVINAKGEVSAATRQRVEQAIAALDYQPHPAAQNLARNHSRVIGLIVPYRPDALFSDPHLLQFVRGVDRVAGQRDASLLLATAVDADPLSAYHRLPHAAAVDGIIVVETGVCAEGAKLLAARGYVWVTLGYCPPGADTYSIHADDYGGARQATMHILSLGHQRIGVIRGDAQSPQAIQQRLAGCRQALADHGLVLDDMLITDGDLTPESGYQATAHLMDAETPPTAIFSLNDRMAVGAMRYLREHGWRVPEQVSVVGFDDVPVAEASGLTTVRQPSLEMGHQAARLLFELIQERTPPLSAVVLPTELVVRASTGFAT